MEKLIFLALDGLRWNVLNEMLLENKLKNIKKLINEGASGIMKADFLLISPKIWASIFTGKKPENHGILDFYSTKEDLRTKLIWEILHEKNKKLGIYRPLTSWDALEVDGFFVPGFLSPKLNVYPEHLNLSDILSQGVKRNQEDHLDIMKNIYEIQELEFMRHANTFYMLIRSLTLIFLYFMTFHVIKFLIFHGKRKLKNLNTRI